jgi:DNA-binding CsgD family transcriptional regulator
MPSAVLAVAASARAAMRANTVAVPGRNGWITLHASLPEGRAAGRVAVVVDRAAGTQSTALRLETYGVTAREREVAALIAQGCSNAEIAAALVISPYTVQDHIKSLFEKTGVGSRRELVARIFLDDYMPALISRTPLTASGGFATA